MRILEYGNVNNPTIILVHGFESPYQIWFDYIEHYKGNYHIIVPVLPGHDVEEKSDFVSFDVTAKEIEDWCFAKSIEKPYAIYGMSMGGVLASQIWRNKRLTFDKVILESSPLMSYGKMMTGMLTKQYMRITQRARERDEKTVRNAMNSMVTEEMLSIFLELLDHISDATIKNYISEVGKFKLPPDIDTPDTKIIYFYGGNANELIFRNVAKFLDKNYKNATTICLKGKGHCEDALLHSSEWINQLNTYLI